MPELLEEIKKLSRAEQLVLAQQIWDLGQQEEQFEEEDEEFRAELVRRVQYALDNPRSGIPWEKVKAQMQENLRGQGA